MNYDFVFAAAEYGLQITFSLGELKDFAGVLINRPTNIDGVMTFMIRPADCKKWARGSEIQIKWNQYNEKVFFMLPEKLNV